MPKKLDTKLNFGSRLATLRKARNITQVQLAKVINSTQRAISYYENEAGYPPAPVLAQLAKALNVTTDELLGLQQPTALEQEEDPQIQRLWKKFQQMLTLPEKDQRAVIRLLNSLTTAKAINNMHSKG